METYCFVIGYFEFEYFFEVGVDGERKVGDWRFAEKVLFKVDVDEPEEVL